MRFSLASCALLLVALPISAQDMSQQMAMDQAQQASTDATMASQQAMQDSQLASQQAQQFAQQANADAMTTPGYPGMYGARAWHPSISVKSGTYDAPIKVRLHERFHGAYLYYTTDGWAPTMPDGLTLTRYAKPYLGPITISRNTRLEAVAVMPYAGASLISDAVYNFPKSSVPTPPAIVSTDGSLHAGLKIPLVFAAPVSSSHAEIGDTVPLHPATSIDVGGHTFLPAQVDAQATVVHVDTKGLAGMPGELTVRVDSLSINGVTVPLHRTATCFGQDHSLRTLAWVMVPVIGLAAIAAHGGEADIAAGTPIVARVTANTRIIPSTPATPAASAS